MKVYLRLPSQKKNFSCFKRKDRWSQLILTLQQYFSMIYSKVKVCCGLIFRNVYLYANKYNCQFNHFIGWKFYQKFSKVLCYIWLKLQVSRTTKKPSNKAQKLVCMIYIYFLFDLGFFFLFDLKIFYYF